MTEPETAVAITIVGHVFGRKAEDPDRSTVLEVRVRCADCGIAVVTIPEHHVAQVTAGLQQFMEAHPELVGDPVEPILLVDPPGQPN